MMIKYYEHPYLLASSLNNFKKDFGIHPKSVEEIVPNYLR